MKISYQWLKQYLPVDLPVEEMSGILTGLGLEVGGVDHIESVRGGLHKVVAGKVLDCVKHPNADRLSLCKVDVGRADLLSIVCGAPNVAAGQHVWVAEVGATLYPTGSEKPFEIGKARVRGEVSEGMICAEDELGLGDDHAGIMVLPESVAPGTSARDYYDVSEDVIFDIDLTPNRSDATSHLGVAEDVSAYLSMNATPVDVRWPDVSRSFDAITDQPFKVEVLNSEACPRYAGLLIRDIRVAESPMWLQNRLRAVGVRPISNIVDITNFVLHEMGQPLHAFDADKIEGQHIIVRTLQAGSTFTTLDEVDRTLTGEDLMICDTNSAGMCIAGVFGGIGTGVTDTTTSIFLESAHFNAEWIRRSSMHHLLRTDAARTFEKGTDPNICLNALKRAADLIIELAGGTQASQVIDVYPTPVEPAQVSVRWQRINRLIGVPIGPDVVKEILSALSMDIVDEREDGVTVRVPTNKADVTREADVIEEILRIYGFNQVPLGERMEIALTWVEQPTRDKLRDTLGGFLASQGFLEMMGMSLTEQEYFNEGPLAIPDDRQVLISNTSNVSLNLMRPDIMVSALEAARYNQNRRQDDFKFYEFGHTYQRKDDKMSEAEHLTLTISGMEHPANWRNHSTSSADFYVMKKYVEAILQRIGLTRYQSSQISDPRYAFGVRYHLGKQTIVAFGKVSDVLGQQFDLKQEVLYADFDLQVLLNAFARQSMVIGDVSKYPAVVRDLSLNLPARTQYAELVRIIRKAGGHQLRHVELFDIYESVEHLGEGRKSYAVQLTFQDDERTMTDEEIDVLVGKMLKPIKSELDGSLR